MANMAKVSILKYNSVDQLTVEWVNEDGQPERVIIPAEAVVDGYADISVLDAGIQVGLPWELILPSVSVTAEKLAAKLREIGIWTEADITPQMVYTALQLALGVDVSNILDAVRLYTKEKEK